MVVALILTKDEYQYKQWLRLVNDGKNIIDNDLKEFPRVTSIEQARGYKSPLPIVYTQGNYYISAKMDKLYRELEAYGYKIIPSPTQERVNARA